MKHIVIVGGGTAGMSVMRNLHRRRNDLKFTLIEPSADHFYQPLWTLVGGGVFPKSKSRRDMKDFIPSDVTWVQDFVTEFKPEENKVIVKSGKEISYDYMVVAPGIQIDWDKIEGLRETLGKNGVCSNYSGDHVEYTWECMKNLKEGRALFTFPAGPIKCAGAPQKVMYLAEETFCQNGVRNKIEVRFMSAGGAIFGVQKYRDALEKVVASRDIKTTFQVDLVKVDGTNKVATFKNLQTGELIEEKFDMLHVSPPQSAPDFIKKSPLAAENGYVDVDKFTTRHNKYPNIFSLGDASSMPNSKTGAAVRRQGPVACNNLLAVIDGQSLDGKYNGYASCPLITGRGKAILAEFDYDGQPDETFPFDQGKERLSMYLLKKWMIPFMYWHAMLKGFF